MYQKKEDAVSPVIGVILMVAITVILAAVIAAFVFGMAGNVGSTKNVALIAELSDGGTHVIVTNHGGADVATLQTITAKDGSGTIVQYYASGVLTDLDNLDVLNDVGDTQTLKISSGSRLIITGKFESGDPVILLDKQF